MLPVKARYWPGRGHGYWLDGWGIQWGIRSPIGYLIDLLSDTVDGLKVRLTIYLPVELVAHISIDLPAGLVYQS